jgi:hypothetical protein
VISYVRGATVTLTHNFIDGGGNPIPPLDTTYPQIQIEDPSGAIVASGVGRSTGTPGQWSFEWTVDPDATVCDGWKVTWTIADLQRNSHQDTEGFKVVSPVEELEGLDRTATYLTMQGQSERVVWKGTTDPEAMNLTINCEVQNLVLYRDKSQLSGPICLDGYLTYYTDTEVFPYPGNYFVIWRTRESVASSWNQQVQTLIVPHWDFWTLVPHLRFLVDKLNKKTTTPLSYLDSELHRSFEMGLDFLNSIHPFTDWQWSGVPRPFHTWWVMCAGLAALNSRQLLEIEVQHTLCLTGDSLVSTPSGLRPLRDVVADARICLHCGERSEKLLKQEGLVEGKVQVLRGDGSVTETVATHRKRKAPVHRLRTEHGYQIQGQDHKVLAIGPDCQIDWVPMTKLTSSHWVALPTALADSEEVRCPFSLDDLMQGKGVRAIPPPKLPEFLTPKLARVLGYLVAEGVCNYKHYFSFSNADQRLHQDFSACVEAIFGIRAINDQNERTACYNTRYSNVVVRDALYLLGLDYSKAPDKTVPWSIFQAPLSVAREFVRAFYEGDGDSTGLRMTSSSKKLLMCIQKLLVRFGILSVLRPHSTPGAWRLGIPAGYQTLYLERIGFIFKQPLISEEPRSSKLWAVPYGKELLQRVRGLCQGSWYPTVKRQKIQPGWELYKLHGGTLSPTIARTLLVEHGETLKRVDPHVWQTLTTLCEFNWSRVRSIDFIGYKTVYDLKLPEGEGLLNHSFQANGLVVHNSGQTVTLEYDHAQPLSEVITRWQEMIREWMVPAKLAAYRRWAGPGHLSVRPYRLVYHNRVFRAATSPQSLQDFPGLLSRLGLYY